MPRARLPISAAMLLAIVTILGPAATRTADAAIVDDQVVEGADAVQCVIRNADAACYQGAAQTVTVGATGDLLAVQLLLSRRADTTEDLEIEIRADSPNGAVLATSLPVAATDIPIGPIDEGLGDYGWATFEFDPALPLDAGDVIAIVLPTTPADGGAWGWLHTVDLYPGGYRWGGVIGSAWQGWEDHTDLSFATIMQVGPSPFRDTTDSSFFWDIEWLFGSGITKGCTLSRFCPKDPVSRGQMAAFLDRALALPTTKIDHFTDDDASSFEASIDRLAAAGITAGCTPTTFCPNDPVSRGQMAAFLDRALHLPTTSVDHFTDDDTSTFEASIDRLAASGITKGCTATTFCPNLEVTRGQMAAFLRRALDAPTP